MAYFKLLHLLNLYMLCCHLVDTVVCQNPSVKSYGGSVTVVGKTETLSTGNVDMYLGLPFAAPPIKNLRFKPTQPYVVPAGTTIINGTHFKNTCYQSPFFLGTSGVMDEDCLYLNIYTPSPKPKTPVAVMIWIHGGAFELGSTVTLFSNAGILSSKNNIIVVTINYRLGSFGFAYMNKDMSGNYGLYDQLEAIKWVNSYIGDFGGDKNQITISGQSAGAISVALHLLSPLSKGLFQRAIMQSCSLFTQTVLSTAIASQMGSRLAKEFNCSGSNIATCMQSYPQSAIYAAQLKLSRIWATDEYILWTPVVDGKFLLQHPDVLLARGMINKVPIMTGVTKDEGSTFLLTILQQIGNAQANVSINNAFFARSLQSFGIINKFAVNATIFEYTNWKDPNSDFLRALAFRDYGTDVGFACPCNAFATVYAAFQQSVFQYRLTYYKRQLFLRRPPWVGVDHGDDLQYIFGIPFMKQFQANYTADERTLSSNMMTLWTAFIKTGNPNTNTDSIKWPAFTLKEQSFANLNINITSEHRLRARKCTFLGQYLPQLVIQTNKLAAATPPTQLAATQNCRINSATRINGSFRSIIPFIIALLALINFTIE